MTSTRRRYLVAVSALLGLGTGCLERGKSAGRTPSANRTATRTATDTGAASETAARSVTVTRSRTNGLAPTEWERTLTVSTADGRVTETLVCGEETRSDSASVPDADLDPFRGLGQDDVASLRSRYACDGRCPTDIPPTTLTITTPETDRTVTVEAGADTPDLLDRLLRALDAAGQHVSTGGCDPVPPTETR